MGWRRLLARAPTSLGARWIGTKPFAQIAFAKGKEAARTKGVRLERAAVEGEEVRFAHDSLLEGDGFELPVPGRETVKPSWEK